MRATAFLAGTAWSARELPGKSAVVVVRSAGIDSTRDRRHEERQTRHGATGARLVVTTLSNPARYAPRRLETG